MAKDRPSKKNNPDAGTKSRSRKSSGVNLAPLSADLLRKLPPQNLEAEQAVLGGVFLQSSVLNDLVEILGEDDFYSPAHRQIYAAMLELYRENAAIDVITAADKLSSMNRLDEIGGPAYLASLTESVVSASNALYHAQIVREKSLRRRLIGISSDILTRVFDSGEQVEALLDESEQAIFSIAEERSKKTITTSKQLIQELFDHLSENVGRGEMLTGVPTGFSRLDELTAGLQRSDLIIVAGRPSMGKTAFALSLALRSGVKAGVPTAIFSLEMSKEQLMMRMLASWAKVEYKRLRRYFLDDDDWRRLSDAADDLSPAPVYIDDTPALSVMDLRARCRRLKADKDIGLVVVDYLQLMRPSRHIESREQEISDISRNLKALAKELDVPVVALSQLNRRVEERKDKRPMLADLRESGAIEQDADLIMFLYREEVYDKDTPKQGLAEVIIGKQRNGPTGLVELAFVGKYTSFEELSRHADIASETEFY